VETWVILAVLGVGFVIFEIFTPSFFMLPAGIAFLATAALSPLLSSTATIGVLAAWLLAVYGVFYRFIWPRMKRSVTPTGASGMVGQVATVTEAISGDAPSGYVKLYGDRWQALSQESFAVGERVVILRTEGNKVVVGRAISA